MMSPSEYLFFVLSAQIHKGQRRWKFYFTELENSFNAFNVDSLTNWSLRGQTDLWFGIA